MRKDYTASSSSRATDARPTHCIQCGIELLAKRRFRQCCSHACYLMWWAVNHADDSPKVVKPQIVNPKTGLRIADFPHLAHQEHITEEILWETRAKYWEGETKTPAFQHSASRNSTSAPLVITGHGAQLRINHGALLVRDGFTHYPQQRQEWRFFSGSSYFPSRIILLDSDGSISFEVIRWLAEQQIPLMTLNWQGEVLHVIGGDTHGSQAWIREVQVHAAQSDVGLQFAIELIREKITQSQATLHSLPNTVAPERALEKLDYALHELRTSAHDIIALRLIEARAALAYFSVWQAMPLRWTGISRHPVPPEWLTIGQRRTMLTGTNRNASHPMNAILNYAYGVLESQVRIAATALGFDPTIGYLHASRPERVALVYDIMEPLRPQVDQMVLKLIRNTKFTPNDFIQTSKGICRLHPQLARKIVSMAVSDDKVTAAVEWAQSTLLTLAKE